MDGLRWATLTAQELRELNKELAEDNRQAEKRERRADRKDEAEEDAEKFDFERDCGARP